VRFDTPRRRMARNGLLGLLAVLAFSTLASPASSVIAPSPAGLPPAIPGGSGINLGLPPTDSVLTIKGRGAFSGMEFIVNQTKELVNQAVSVTWKGGQETITGVTNWDGNYVQIMQCWGEDDGTNPTNPGPPPEQCQQGAADAVFGNRLTEFSVGNYALTRVMSTEGWPSFDTNAGSYEPETGTVWRPFQAVDGTVVDRFIDSQFDPRAEGGQYWLNPYFNVVTTNEVAGSRTLANGSGGELFEVQTGIESSGLGCGQRVSILGGPLATPKCWLVIVPRGTPEQENAGRPFSPQPLPVATSPLAEGPWQSRIAIPLEFNPVDTACQIGAEQRRLGGNELLSPAIASWQQSLCSTPGSLPFVYGVTGDPVARQQLLASSAGAPQMIAVSQPYDPSTVDPANPVVYAPLTASGAVIAFNVERTVLPGAPAEENALNGLRVADLKLTPRLVAKLLSQSYRNQTAILESSPYPWAATNPIYLLNDPDFLQFNPEFQYLIGGGARNMGGFVMPARNSDLAKQLWHWILADPEAKAWMDGSPDPWGMRVNPVYATLGQANPSGIAFGTPVPENFPKSDPYCYQGAPRGAGGVIIPPLVCGTDWLPYTQSLQEAGQFTRVAGDRARIEVNPFPISPDTVYRRTPPQRLGFRSFMSITDSATAARFGLQTAQLSRSGDNGPNRTFIAPDQGGLTAAVAAMKPKAEPAVLEPDPTVSAPAAYPLAILTYGVIRPLSLDTATRQDFARFVDYASGPGQVPGRNLGQLPEGFAPLPVNLREQAKTAAVAIRDLRAPPATEPPPVTGSSGGSAPATSQPSGQTNNAGPSSTPKPAAANSASLAAAPSVVAVTETASAEVPNLGLLTPIVALARNRFVIPALAMLAVLSALGALEITKRPRRGLSEASTRSSGSSSAGGPT